MSDVSVPVKRRKWRGLLYSALALVLAGAGTAAYVFRPMPLSAAPASALNKADAAKGKYLAQIGNCAACHSVPDKAGLSGGVKFKTDFGVIYSTNITPDPVHGIGKWSYAQFHAAMKHGVRPDGTHLYPAFPYTSFARLSDEDVASLYAYLQTVAPSAEPNRANEMRFPFGDRRLLYFWKRLFHDSTTYAPDAGKSEAWNRGAYLVEGITHCGACHTPRNMLGGLKEDKALQGGTFTDRVGTGAYRAWSAVDLTPGPHGLAKWSADDIVRYLTQGKNSKAVMHGPMNEVFASTRQMSPLDAASVATYLKGVEPSAERVNLSWFRRRIGEGEVVYTVHCGTCHLPDGKGDKILGVSLHNNPLVQEKSPASLINVILYGPDLPPPPFVSGRTKMKPFGKRLSDEDVAAVASYLRSSFGNNASAVSPDEVKEQR